MPCGDFIRLSHLRTPAEPGPVSQRVGTVPSMDLFDTRTVSRTAMTDWAAVWDLLPIPVNWPRWAPQMSRVTTDDDRPAGARVSRGEQLHIHTIIPGISLPVTITDVEEPVRWDMMASVPLGRIDVGHRLNVEGAMTTVTVTMRWDGVPLLGALVLQSYRPLAGVALNRLLKLPG